MRKTILICISLLVTQIFWAQSNTVSIYEYGKPLISCEANFENLFNNWGKWIANSDETELISYEYKTTLKNKKQVEAYSKKITELTPLIFSQKTKNGIEDANKMYYYVSFQEDPIPYDKKKMQHYVMNFLQPGNAVYELKYKINGEIYHHYTFCDPSTHKITFDPYFSGIKRNIKEIETL